MKVLIQSKTLAVTAALRTFIERQLAKLSRLNPQALSATVFLETIERKKNDLRAAVVRVKVDLPGKDVMIEHRSADLYTAVVEVAERAFRAVKKSKERRLSQRRSSRLSAAYLALE